MTAAWDPDPASLYEALVDDLLIDPVKVSAEIAADTSPTPPARVDPVDPPTVVIPAVQP